MKIDTAVVGILFRLESRASMLAGWGAPPSHPVLGKLQWEPSISTYERRKCHALALDSRDQDPAHDRTWTSVDPQAPEAF